MILLLLQYISYLVHLVLFLLLLLSRLLLLFLLLLHHLLLILLLLTMYLQRLSHHGRNCVRDPFPQNGLGDTCHLNPS